jgi:hypothetical protein
MVRDVLIYEPTENILPHTGQESYKSPRPILRCMIATRTLQVGTGDPSPVRRTLAILLEVRLHRRLEMPISGRANGAVHQDDFRLHGRVTIR